MSETAVGVSEMIISEPKTGVLMMEMILSAAKKTISAAEAIFAVAKTMVFMTQIIIAEGNKMVTVDKKMLFVPPTVVRTRQPVRCGSRCCTEYKRLPEDHPANFVSDVVDPLNLSAIEAVYEKEFRRQPPRGFPVLRCFLQPLRHPHFDNRLPGHSQAFRFFIQKLNHPYREVDVDPFLFLDRSSALGKVKMSSNVLTLIELFIKFLSLHRCQSPLSWSAVRI